MFNNYLPQNWLVVVVGLTFLHGVATNYENSINFVNAVMVNDVLHFTYTLEQWLDSSQRPCDNFFGYVCARSINTSQAQLDKRRQQQQLKFEQFLEGGNADNEQLMDAELKLKYFYVSCRQARSAENLKSTLMYRSVGGWPVIDDTIVISRKRHNMTWLQVLSVFHEAGIAYFFKTKIELISNRRILHIEPDESVRFSLRKFEQLSSEIMQSFEVEAGRARLVALEVLYFERSSRDIMNGNLTTAVDVQEYSYGDFKTVAFGGALQLDWDGYFRKVMGKPLKDSDLVTVKGMQRLQHYFELMQNTTLTRFLNWLWLDYLMDKTQDDCRKLAEEYFAPVYQHIIERSSVNKIHMAQMYSDLSEMYDALLLQTPWIDELTQQSSKLFSSRIMHLTLNGNAQLDEDYEQLAITPRNFYRNLEKSQRFINQRLKIKAKRSPQQTEVARAAEEFMKIFLIINNLLGSKQNLTAPLNYMMVGEHFSEMMISGGSFHNPGSWRSMDSEQQFSRFDKCISRQGERQIRLPRKSIISNVAANHTMRNFNLNDLILKMLAQQLTWQSYQQWLHKERAVEQRLDALLQAGRLQMSLRKLYFVLTTLVDCQRNPVPERSSFVNAYLKNSLAFTQTFKCQRQDKLNALNKCKVV